MARKLRGRSSRGVGKRSDLSTQLVNQANKPTDTQRRVAQTPGSVARFLPLFASVDCSLSLSLSLPLFLSLSLPLLWLCMNEQPVSA